MFRNSGRMVGMNIRVTACEAALESILQLSLQLFIIFKRARYLPSGAFLQVKSSSSSSHPVTQVATMVSSLIITSLGETEDFLQTKMNMKMEAGMCEEYYANFPLRKRSRLISKS